MTLKTAHLHCFFKSKTFGTNIIFDRAQGEVRIKVHVPVSHDLHPAPITREICIGGVLEGKPHLYDENDWEVFHQICDFWLRQYVKKYKQRQKNIVSSKK